ncbi:monofunctional biosynthetic peptidoglycan transglycosylase [Novosphingobium sp. YJ-S2-02]|uniref:Biosynthetic peptidoglycan transglycosylase n=1 Tax=Novosphingobium aureum TaxID=2792964 RepID=A0A931MKH8_9SPHN|nr:monofunctional biosynthetic peptidoglycan transglycosylase [Novosphingobium aureum]MBH0112479.1 monofunctional biosynthetic peptidoglycan transglycosylase [Novosphingobium aureum]
MRLVAKIVIWFVVLSVAITALYRVVPPPVTVTMITDANGITKDWEPLENIDRNMVAAAIGAEDSKFCSHDGFDSDAIESAMKRNAEGGRLRGGSTISQQTAKNVFLWQGEGWTRYLRKGLEVWFTFLVEALWDKRRIMEVYLNVAETGIGTYGVEAGAQRYFGKSAANLSRLEAARMAAALPSPKTRSVKNPHGFVRRYGSTIAARINTVRASGYDACVYQ